LPLAVARRILRAAFTLLAASFVVFASLYLAPGSPLGYLTHGRSLTPAQLAALKAQYHLNDPFFSRYGQWLWNVLHGNLGQSLVFHESVSTLLNARIGSTLFLVIYAALLIVIGGVVLGTVAGVRGGLVDGGITVTTTIGLATPSFVVAMALVSLLAVDVHAFPAIGSGSGFFDRLWHMTLPAIALAIAGVAYVAQTTRSAVRAEMSNEHADTARVRGIPEPLVVRRHVFRNALIPIVTVSGLSIAGLVAGLAIVETAFGLSGLGSYLIQAVSQNDFAVVQAITLILVSVFVVTNLFVDLAYRLIDPRIAVRSAGR
jgi:peptide/nickel transport system permease protein